MTCCFHFNPGPWCGQRLCWMNPGIPRWSRDDIERVCKLLLIPPYLSSANCKSHCRPPQKDHFFLAAEPDPPPPPPLHSRVSPAPVAVFAEKGNVLQNTVWLHCITGYTNIGLSVVFSKAHCFNAIFHWSFFLTCLFSRSAFFSLIVQFSGLFSYLWFSSLILALVFLSWLDLNHIRRCIFSSANYTKIPSFYCYKSYRTNRKWQLCCFSATAPGCDLKFSWFIGPNLERAINCTLLLYKIWDRPLVPKLRKQLQAWENHLFLSFWYHITDT